MLRTFNCGIGMAMVIDPDALAEVSAVLQEHGERVVELGRVAPRRDQPMVFSGRLKLS
jgi:phosphoribosylformylglycinamidine cyclo-ligase